MTLVLDLNDANLRARDGGRALGASPGFALLENRTVVESGVAAERQCRLHPRRIVSDHWYRLSTEPLDGFAPMTRADVAAAQLDALLPKAEFAGRELVVVVPGYFERTALGLLKGICQASGFTVRALVDAATAATRQRYVDAVPLHIEFGLHGAWVARLHQTSAATTLEDVQTLDGSGLANLTDRWMRWFAAEFVRQSRFDPLHSASSEQMLYDALPGWFQQLARTEEATLRLTPDGTPYEITVASVDVVNVVLEHYQRLADLARAMIASNEKPVFQLRDAALQLPGLSDLLVARAGGSFVAVPDDAMVAGVLARSAALPADANRVVRELPVESELAGVADVAPQVHGLPTHLLVGERAFRLDAERLTVGAGSPDGRSRYLALDGALAGVSSIHCEIALQGEQCLIVDRSRYGTFLNGNRINGSAALRAGDVVRVGTPGQEMQLIREERA